MLFTLLLCFSSPAEQPPHIKLLHWPTLESRFICKTNVLLSVHHLWCENITFSHSWSNLKLSYKVLAHHGACVASGSWALSLQLSSSWCIQDNTELLLNFLWFSSTDVTDGPVSELFMFTLNNDTRLDFYYVILLSDNQVGSEPWWRKCLLWTFTHTTL